MTVRIDSVLKNAVNGVQDGLTSARRVSTQLAVATPNADEAVATESAGDRQINTAQVVKDPEQTLGTLVDVKA